MSLKPILIKSYKNHVKSKLYSIIDNIFTLLYNSNSICYKEELMYE